MCVFICIFKSICISLSTLIYIEKPNVHTDTFSSSPIALDLFSFLSSVMGRNLFPSTLNVVTSLIDSPACKQSLGCCHNPLPYVDTSPTTPGLRHPWVPAGRPSPDVLRALTSQALPPRAHTHPSYTVWLSYTTPGHLLSQGCPNSSLPFYDPTEVMLTQECPPLFVHGGCSLFFQLSCSFITILYNIS